jgi:hypothetical protein
MPTVEEITAMNPLEAMKALGIQYVNADSNHKLARLP